MRKQSNYRHRRRGAAAVEFAFVAIPLFLFIFATVEFGRTLMAISTMEEAARSGCRSAIIRGATDSSVEDEVDGLMRTAGIKNYDVDIDPSNFSSLDRWEPVSVTVKTTFDQISWLPTPMYFGNMELTASCTLPKEYSDTD